MNILLKGGIQDVVTVMSVEDHERSGRRSDIDNDQLRALVEANPRTTVRELVPELGVMHVMISNHMEVTGKSKKLDKQVSPDMNENYKNRRFKVQAAILLRNKNDPFFKWIVTCDEKQIIYEDRLSGWTATMLHNPPHS